MAIKGYIVSVLLLCLFSPSLGFAQNKVVVIPLVSTVGTATPADVVKGKTFSSSAGEGLTGALELSPAAQSYKNSNEMIFNLIPAGGPFTMGSPSTAASRLAVPEATAPASQAARICGKSPR